MALDSMRKGASRFFGVILIGLLVVSFAVWGIADIFRGYGSQTLVKAGDIEIGPQEYLRVQREVLNTMSGQAGKQLTLQEARAAGLDSQVMERLIGGAVLDNHAQALGLGVTDEVLLQEIMKDPAFQDTAGNFSPLALQQALQGIGMDEETFLAVQRERNLRRQLLSTIGDTVVAPDMLMDALDVYNNQTRTLRFVLVPEDKVPPSPAPTETELKTYYDNHQDSFTQPELRSIGVLEVNPETVKEKVEISDEELRKTYEADKAKYDTPEKRHVYQMSFPSKEAAQAAYDAIQGGKSFEDVAKENNLSDSDIDLGVVTQNQLADPVIAETAFKLNENQVSAPVQGRLGANALIKVSNILKGKEVTFEDVKRKVESEVLKQKAEGAILDLHDKIEDARAAGSTLAEVAGKFDLPYQQIEQVSRQGRTLDDKEPAIPQKQALLQAAFASDVGIENDPVDAGENGFVWYDVLAVTPSQVKPFDQVKDEVDKLWRESDRQERLAKYTDELLAKLKSGGTSFEDIAKEVGAEIETTQPLKRTGVALNVLPPAVAQAFALPAKGYGSAESGVEGARILFQVVDVIPPKPMEDPAKQELKRQLQLFVSGDILAQYFAALQQRYEVTINQAAVDRMTGAEEQP